MAQLNFDLAQKDADRIAKLSKELANASKDLKLELNRQKEQKKILYEEVAKRLDAIRDEYNRFRRFTEMEMTVKEAIIAKQADIIQKMYNELRATKVLIEIPRLAQMRTKFDMKGLDFKDFHKVLDQITGEVKSDLLAQDLISDASREFTGSSRRN